MSIENLISRLDKVKGRNGHWTACCPAHDDRGPSLAIKPTEDGRILLHCFAGCDVHSIVTAVGMDLTDLFPPRDAGSAPVKPAFYASDLLRIIAFETSIVRILANDIVSGTGITKPDVERLRKASDRIEEARRYAKV